MKISTLPFKKNTNPLRNPFQVQNVQSAVVDDELFTGTFTQPHHDENIVISEVEAEPPLAHVKDRSQTHLPMTTDFLKCSSISQDSLKNIKTNRSFWYSACSLTESKDSPLLIDYCIFCCNIQKACSLPIGYVVWVYYDSNT